MPRMSLTGVYRLIKYILFLKQVTMIVSGPPPSLSATLLQPALPPGLYIVPKNQLILSNFNPPP